MGVLEDGEPGRAAGPLAERASGVGAVQQARDTAGPRGESRE